MDLLITDGNMSHFVYIKRFNRFMCNKTFASIVYNVLVVKEFL